MNNEEAVREWNKYIRCQEKGKSRECYLEHGFDCCDKCGNEMEISIDLVRISVDALEKQILKKPYKVGIRAFECPVCHKVLFYKGVPCRCGQMIDWSDEDGII